MFSTALKPSPWLAGWILSLATVLLFPAWFSALPWWLCLGIDAGMVVWMLRALRNYWWVGERHLSFREGCWTLVQGGEPEAVRLDGEFYLSRWLVVLVFRTSRDKKIPVVITPDSIDHDSMRRLRIVLKQLPASETVA